MMTEQQHPSISDDTAALTRVAHAHLLTVASQAESDTSAIARVTWDGVPGHPDLVGVEQLASAIKQVHVGPIGHEEPTTDAVNKAISRTVLVENVASQQEYMAGPRTYFGFLLRPFTSPRHIVDSGGVTGRWQRLCGRGTVRSLAGRAAFTKANAMLVQHHYGHPFPPEWRVAQSLYEGRLEDAASFTDALTGVIHARHAQQPTPDFMDEYSTMLHMSGSPTVDDLLLDLLDYRRVANQRKRNVSGKLSLMSPVGAESFHLSLKRLTIVVDAISNDIERGLVEMRASRPRRSERIADVGAAIDRVQDAHESINVVEREALAEFLPPDTLATFDFWAGLMSALVALHLAVHRDGAFHLVKESVA